MRLYPCQRKEWHVIYRSNQQPCTTRLATQKYHVHTLVYYEQYDMMDAAIRREKQLKYGIGHGKSTS